MNYAIAYHDPYGRGFDINKPFVDDGVTSLDDARYKQETMIMNDYNNVTIFSYNEDELLEIITWDFVLSHVVNE